MKGRTAEAMETKLTYSVAEVARLLGLSVNSTYGAVRQKEIPSIRVGRRIFIPRVALEAMLAGAA